MAPKRVGKKPGICNSLAGNREASVQSDKLGTFLTSVEIQLGILRLGAEEIGVTREDQQTASRQRQGPKASCVHSSLARSEPKRNARRDRAKDSRVGSWQSRGGGAGTRLREGGRKSPWACHKMEAKDRKWRPGRKRSSRAQEEAHLNLRAKNSTPSAAATPHGPPRPTLHPHSNTH